MAIFGFLTSTKGITLPIIKEQFNINYTNSGLILFFSSIGYLSATFITGFLISKYGFKKVLIGAFSVSILAAVVFFVSKSYVFVVLGYYLLGFSFGLFEVSVNSLAVKIFIRNIVVLMNLTHLFYGVGAAIGPSYSSFIIKSGFNWSYIYLFFIIVLVLSIAAILPVTFPEPDATGGGSILVNFKALLHNRKIWMFVLLLGFIMSIEMGLSSWLVNYLSVIKLITIEKGSVYLTLFFAFLTLGRLISGFIAAKIGHIRIIFIYLSGLIVSVLLGMLLSSTYAILFSAAGFFISIFFPNIMVIISHEFKENTSQVIGTIITFAAIIGMLSVFIIGKANDLIGVGFGLCLVIVYGLISLTFLSILSKKHLTHKQD
ncbi:MAG: MFS transporter [Clostridia bacterium]|nr:MFS transporter [Clostridia bacterium]